MLKSLLTLIFESLKNKNTAGNVGMGWSPDEKLKKEVNDLKDKIATLEETVNDYIAMETEAIEMANQIKEVVDLWES